MSKIRTYNKADLKVEGGYLIDDDNNAVVWSDDFAITKQYDRLLEWMDASTYLAKQPRQAPKPSLDGFKSSHSDDFVLAHTGELEELLTDNEQRNEMIDKALDNRRRLEYVQKIINRRFKELALFCEKDEITVCDDEGCAIKTWKEDALLLTVEDLASFLLIIVEEFEDSKEGNAWMLKSCEPWHNVCEGECVCEVG